MRASIHPYRPVRLRNLAVHVNGDQPLRDRISLFPVAVVAAAMQLATRIVGRALLLANGHPCRTPRQRVQARRLVERHSSILGEDRHAIAAITASVVPGSGDIDS